MNLKDFLSNKETKPELYWSLVIENSWVQAGIWYIGKDSAEIISVGPGSPWAVESELIGAVDAALSSAVQKLPENFDEPNKTVFGVPSSWVKNGEINEEHLLKIKTICSDLSLNPVGFVVLSEAIAHLYKSQEGTPLSAIILGLGEESLELTVFNLGNLVGTTQISRSVSLIEDVTEGLTRFNNVEPLPSRFIVYNGKGGELEEAKEQLMQDSWEENNIKFLHTPKVEILVSDNKVLATALAGANEIGEVSKITSVEVVEEADVIPEEGVLNFTETQKDVTPESLGFEIDQDVSVSSPPVVNTPTPTPVVHTQNELKINNYLQKTKSLFHGFSKKLFTKSQVPNKSSRKNYLPIFLILFVLLVGGGGIFWYFVPKANITIYVTPKKFDQEIQMSLDTVGATENVVTVTGDKTKATTGTKLIGDKAKGSVQIQNGTAFPINLTSGAFLVSSSNLKFVLDNSASVSAALSPSSPGTANVSVTAETIGSSYNLAKDEIFKVGNYPKAEVDATSVADFSGGSSREISAVDKSDKTDLEKQLTDELIAKAKTDILSKVTENQIFVDDFSQVDIVIEDFDHKVGDEASSLKLNLSLKVHGVYVDRGKFLEYARSVLKDKIPQGFVLRDSQIGYKFTFVEKKDGKLTYKVAISANFLPQVNSDDIIKKILGKTILAAEDYLSSVSGFGRASITIKPHLPGFFGTLPHIGKNITIEVVADQ